jgi:hypothetical protein
LGSGAGKFTGGSADISSVLTAGNTIDYVPNPDSGPLFGFTVYDNGNLRTW